MSKCAKLCQSVLKCAKVCQYVLNLCKMSKIYLVMPSLSQLCLVCHTLEQICTGPHTLALCSTKIFFARIVTFSLILIIQIFNFFSNRNLLRLFLLYTKVVGSIQSRIKIPIFPKKKISRIFCYYQKRKHRKMKK